MGSLRSVFECRIDIAKNMHEACATIHCTPHKHTERECGCGCGEQRFLNKNESAVLICLEKDQEIPPHPEPYYVLFHILEGEGIITAGSELYHVKDGHMVYVESNDIRGIKCTKE